MAQQEKPPIDHTTTLSPIPSHLYNRSLESMATTLTPSPSCSPRTNEKHHPEDYDPTSSHPFSPFYSHPTTRTSLDIAQCSKTNLQLYEHDLETGSRLTQASTHGLASTHNLHDTEKVNETVWPGTKQLVKRRKARQANESCCCGPWLRLSKKQRLWIQIVVALLLVGAVTGLGVGITKAVGGGVFRNYNTPEAPVGS